LTGEDATYAGVSPKRSFDPLNGGWGAVQLVGRYARLDVDEAAFPYFADPDTAARGARAWSAGANWFLNQNVRLNTSFSRTTFQGGAGAKATVTKQPENVFFTRLQLHF
jgi:phosphate-selective porin OprO/OprP